MTSHVDRLPTCVSCGGYGVTGIDGNWIHSQCLRPYTDAAAANIAVERVRESVLALARGAPVNDDPLLSDVMLAIDRTRRTLTRPAGDNGVGMRWFVLDGQTPRPASLAEWARQFDDVRVRTVAHEPLPHGVEVSTVFVGYDVVAAPGSPMLFETMVFNGAFHGVRERYATWDEADAGHRRIVSMVVGAAL